MRDISDVARQVALTGAASSTRSGVRSIAPWAVSIVLHLGVLVIAAFITWSVVQSPEQDDSIVIVADFNALKYEPVTPLLDAQPQPQLDAALAPESLPVEPLSEILRDRLAEADADPLALLAGAAMGGSTSLSQYAPQPQAGPEGAAFMGVSSSNASKIVYLIDATGSMIAHLQIVLDELTRSLDKLSDRQSFAIIFFQADKAIEAQPGGRLVAARAQAKSRAIQWSRQNVVPAGGTNPLPAIEKALSLKPDVIFMLSHGISDAGQFEVDQRELLARLDQLNPIDRLTGRRTTQINCIQFIKQDPLGTMEKIAREHGAPPPHGYRFIDRAQLGL